MSLLSKLFGYVSAKESEGISLDEEKVPCWECSNPKSFPLFLRALNDLVPQSSVLFIEGTRPSKDIRVFLEARKPKEITKVALGTIWPRQKCYHVLLTTENLEGLAQLAEKHNEFEIAVHLHVYKDNKILLQWYDAFTDPFCISKEIPEDKVKSFCDKLGINYKDFKGWKVK